MFFWARIERNKYSNSSFKEIKMRRKKIMVLVSSALFVFFSLADLPAQQPEKPKIRVLFTYGGHGFDEKEMYKMLDSLEGVVYEKAEMPKSLDLFRPGLEKEYDCIIMYDMYKFPYEEKQIENFKSLLETGIPVIILHHCICGYDGCDDFPKMIGGRYLFAEKTVIEGKTYPESSYDHDQDIEVGISDKTHPIMKGIEDFTIRDETYGNVYVNPKVHVLFETGHPKSTKQLGWTWKYGKSAIFVNLLGHDKNAYQNPNYRKILRQGIDWTIDETKSFKE